MLPHAHASLRGAVVSVAVVAIAGMMAVARPARAADDQVYTVKEVTAPKVLSKTEPEYSDEALAANRQGTVVMLAVIDEKGSATDIRVTHSLGMGLDEKAVECLQQWRFQAGTKNGEPVKVRASIELNFRLPAK